MILAFAEAYLEDLQETLDRLKSQEKDLQTCIRHLRRQTGEEINSWDESEIRITAAWSLIQV